MLMIGGELMLFDGLGQHPLKQQFSTFDPLGVNDPFMGSSKTIRKYR